MNPQPSWKRPTAQRAVGRFRFRGYGLAPRKQNVEDVAAHGAGAATVCFPPVVLGVIRLVPVQNKRAGLQAYDAEYNWREEDRRRPGTVGRDILDVLFPRR